jgi:hypothetical protein
MFNVKHLFLAVALAAGVAHSGHFCHAQGPHQIVVTQKLVLTPIQAKQIDAQREKILDQIYAIHANTKLSEAEKQSAMKAAIGSFGDFLSKTLSPAQMHTLSGPAAIHELLVAGHEMKLMMTMLDLTPEQVAQAKQVHAEFAPQAEAIQNDASLSREAKDEKLAALHMAALHRIAQFLSPEQQQKLHAMIQAHMGDHGSMHEGMMNHGNIPPK